MLLIYRIDISPFRGVTLTMSALPCLRGMLMISELALIQCNRFNCIGVCTSSDHRCPQGAPPWPCRSMDAPPFNASQLGGRKRRCINTEHWARLSFCLTTAIALSSPFTFASIPLPYLCWFLFVKS